MTSTAERLMQMASEADIRADEFVELDGPDALERAAFHRGQASGFRQSAYYAAILEGTNAND